MEYHSQKYTQALLVATTNVFHCSLPTQSCLLSDSQNHRVFELERASGAHLAQPHAKAGSPRAVRGIWPHEF